MAAEEKWYFSKEQLANTPSRKHGYDGDKELSSRQQAANLIQDMGQRLQVTQLCINTAIVYMHRFYMFHSFNRFHRNPMAAAALFLAAKVEEQPRKLEHVIKVSQLCLHRGETSLDTKSESYLEQAQELVINENILLQTLGFDVAIDHPHTHVVRCCHLVKASKDLAQTSYFMASNSLHLTTMCLQYKPTVVACFCIHLASKWSNWEIPQSTEGKPWFWYVDKSVTQELLEQLTEEFLVMFEKCPSRLKKKIMSLSSNQNSSMLSAFSNDHQERKRNGEGSSANTSGVSFSGSSSSNDDVKKKQEYQRHHPDYKKMHMSHHMRPDSHGMQSSKSSCMFGPPRSTLPHSSGSSNQHVRTVPSKPNSGTSSSSSGSSSIQPEVSGIIKPEYLHHRPRRPEEKVVRNHEPVHQIKKYETKTVNSGINEFNQATSSSGPSNSSSSRNFPLPTSHLVIKQEIKTEPIELIRQTLLAPPKPKTPPPIAKVSSIFSPEKSTPPDKSQIPLLKPKKEKEELPKLDELFKPIPLVQPIEQKPLLVIKEEKPPDLPKNEPIQDPPLLEESSPVEQKKKKKKHKEHKEKHKDKQKDKHKHKHKNRDPEPIKITIPRDKIGMQPQLPQLMPEGLKIKITKDKIMPVAPKVKIKIPREKIKEPKKRDRTDDGNHLPSKYHRPNGTSLQVNLDLMSRENDYNSNINIKPIRGPCTPPGNPVSPPIFRQRNIYRPRQPFQHPIMQIHNFPPVMIMPYFTQQVLVPNYPPPPPLPEGPPPQQPPLPPE